MKSRSNKEHTVGSHFYYSNSSANNRSIWSLHDFVVTTELLEAGGEHSEMLRRFARRRRVAKPRNRSVRLELVCPARCTRVFTYNVNIFMYAFREEGFRRKGCPLFNAKYDVNDSGDLNNRQQHFYETMNPRFPAW